MMSLRRARRPRDSARSCSPEVDLVTTAALVAFIRANVRSPDIRSASSQHDLRVQLNHLGVALDRIAAWLPGHPDLVPRAVKLSLDASIAAKEALIEACSAAEQWDDEARFQAELASDAAGEAARAALDLQRASRSQ